MEDTSIIPPYTVLVDEAGTPSFEIAQASESSRGYIAAAVVIPELEREALNNILPRDSRGQLLKSASQGMTPNIATSFVTNLMNTKVDVCLVLLRTDSSTNVELASELTELAKERRNARHKPHISTSCLVYFLVVKDAILRAWDQVSRRLSTNLSYFDVVMDTANVSKYDKGLFQKVLKQAMQQHSGVVCRDVRWVSPKDEPLLNIPDILAGVYLRNVMHKDVPEAWQLLEAADRNGRIFIQDGIETMDPDKASQNQR